MSELKTRLKPLVVSIRHNGVEVASLDGYAHTMQGGGTYFEGADLSTIPYPSALKASFDFNLPTSGRRKLSIEQHIDRYLLGLLALEYKGQQSDEIALNLAGIAKSDFYKSKKAVASFVTTIWASRDNNDRFILALIRKAAEKHNGGRIVSFADGEEITLLPHMLQGAGYLLREGEKTATFLLPEEVQRRIAIIEI